MLYNTYSPVLINSCNITALDPWDESLRPFWKKPLRLPCEEKYELFYFRSDGQLYMNTSVADKHGLELSTQECWFQVIRRMDGDLLLKMLPRQQLQLPMEIRGHIFRVTCNERGNNITLYDMAHFNPFFNEYAKRDSKIEAESARKPSIIIFGLDSVSRSHAIRNLQKSYAYLRDKLQSDDLEGFRKVGENTFPNIVPLLTGKSQSWFPHIFYLRMHTDSMPLLWNESPAATMATFFAEDRPDISTFNFMKSGFKKIPTDFYFRPYTLAMNEFEPVFGKKLGKPTLDCYGNRNHFEIEIDYLKSFLQKYNKRRKFAFFWSNQVGHEHFTSVSRGDEPFLDFLRWMVSETDMRNTIFIALSDHGFRLGGASLTHIGRAENNNPWLMIHVPESVTKTYPKLRTHLKENSKHLVTHYDIHQTVLDAMHGRGFEDKTLVPTQQYVVPRNVFHPIPDDRTCLDAGVDEIFCTCVDTEPLDVHSPLVQSLANFIIKHINKIIYNPSNICSRIMLLNITEAKVEYSKKDLQNLHNYVFKNSSEEFTRSLDQDTGRYTIFINTFPGSGVFQGTVDFMSIGKAASLDDQMTVVGEPIRLSRYGNQSHCVDDVKLKTLCYCTDLL
ncbi:uncharacterized protein LOC128237750 [Mya arenaria]|uniref:uncharacterized protein LOC128237750 n=1 Tax=Mya arenaria TaxID=6604 RepID=UPI0022E6B52C|nr:uncharacterized protein LOC128237750 [Mya arenaria]